MSDIERAVGALERGGLVVFPTETVFGVGCLLDRPHAIEALFELKARSQERACQILLPSRDAIPRVAILGARGGAVAAAFMPGPLTLILKARPGIPALVTSEGKVGVRVPSHPVAQALLETAGPMVASSANRSGEPTPGDIEAVRALFGDGVAVYVEGEPPPEGSASTVLDPCLGVLREGAVSLPDLERLLGPLAADW